MANAIKQAKAKLIDADTHQPVADDEPVIEDKPKTCPTCKRPL